MRELWNKLARAIARLRKRSEPVTENRRQTPRFICRCPVNWESGHLRGQGELREVSSTGLRLRTDQALLAGRHIRIRPLDGEPDQRIALDVALGTVVYSKNRKGRVEIGVDLLYPERVSRFAWYHQLRNDPALKSFAKRRSPLPSVEPRSGVLRVLGSAPRVTPSQPN